MMSKELIFGYKTTGYLMVAPTPPPPSPSPRPVRPRVTEISRSVTGQLGFFSYEHMEIFTKKRTARRDLAPARFTGLLC